jgi:hypothetical protein
MKVVLTILMLLISLVACRHLPPGHDPNGPGNSENAPGHNKRGNGPGNSDNAPGQIKKHGY